MNIQIGIMRLICSVVIMQLTIQIAAAQELKTISLQDCIQLAMENNSQLKIDELHLKRLSMDSKQSYLNRLPSLSGYIGHGFSKGRSVDPTTNQFTEQSFGYGNQSLNADLTIFNGFKTLNDIRATANAYSAGKAEFESAKMILKLDIIEAYLQVQTAKDLLDQAQNQFQVTQEQMRRAEIMNKEGAFPPSDYYDLKGQIKSEQDQIENSKKNWIYARLRLARLIEVPENEMGDLEVISLDMVDRTWNAESLYQKAAENLPSMQALDYRIRQSLFLYKMSKGDYFPSVSLGAGYSSNFSNKVQFSYFEQFQNNLGKSISIGLRIPIFNRLQTYNQVRRAALNKETAELQKTKELENLRETTAKVVFDLQNTMNSISNLQEQVVMYAESFRIAQVHYESGASNSYVFLLAKTKLDNARQALLIKKYSYILQKYLNDYYSGDLNL